MPRLYLDAVLEDGARLALDEAQTRYLAGVLRLKAGAVVRVFNGRDGEFAAAFDIAGRRAGRLQIGARTRAQIYPPDLWVLFSPLKRQATDWLVEKATELGAAALQPVMMRRTVADHVRADRLISIAREAAEQTERLDIPDIRAAQPLAGALAQWDLKRPLIYCDEQGEAAPLLEALLLLFPSEGEADRAPRGTAGAQVRRVQANGALSPLSSARRDDRSPSGGGAPRKLALLIGPEGGFDPEERATLRSHDFVMPVSLGPRILRAETAAVAALALIQAAWGDWVNPPNQ
jgi:16S rRNA (uracil1498-N3)-methyltransferase